MLKNWGKFFVISKTIIDAIKKTIITEHRLTTAIYCVNQFWRNLTNPNVLAIFEQLIQFHIQNYRFFFFSRNNKSSINQRDLPFQKLQKRNDTNDYNWWLRGKLRIEISIDDFSSQFCFAKWWQYFRIGFYLSCPNLLCT